MKYIRIYTGTDGESHFEDVEVSLEEPRNLMRSSQLENTTAIRFREASGDFLNDWHNMLRPQYVITLAGKVEIEISDATKRQFGPGDIMLAEDTSGRGHITRVVSNEIWKSIFITLE